MYYTVICCWLPEVNGVGFNFRLSDKRWSWWSSHFCPGMADFWTKVTVGLLKGVAFVYDIITFLPYYLIDKPSEKLKISRRIKVNIPNIYIHTYIHTCASVAQWLGYWAANLRVVGSSLAHACVYGKKILGSRPSAMCLRYDQHWN